MSEHTVIVSEQQELFIIYCCKVLTSLTNYAHFNALSLPSLYMENSIDHLLDEAIILHFSSKFYTMVTLLPLHSAESGLSNNSVFHSHVTSPPSQDP